MPTYTQTTTASGLAALNATLTGTVLNITRVDVGSGSVSSPATATALGSEKIASVAIAGKAILSSGTFALSVVVNNASVTTAFNMTEVGIWGTSGGGPEQLLIYISDSAPTTIGTNATAQNVYLRVGVGTANTASVTVTITAGIYALESDFVSHLADAGAHPQAFQNPVNVVRHAFPGTAPATPLLANQSLATAADGSVSWQPGLQLINVNTTLYVATTGNDLTALPNDPTHPFLTIQGALNYLSNFQIFTGVTVTISVAAGVYNLTSTIIVNHPQGQNIQIIGSIGSAINTTSASMSGSTVTLTTSSGGFSSISAGDYILSTSLATVNAITESGVAKVLTCNGTSLTYVLGGSALTISGSIFSVVKLNTVLNCSSVLAGVSISGNGLSLLQNFGVINTTSASNRISGVNVSSATQCNLDHVGVSGFADTGSNLSFGFGCNNGGTINASSCYASSNNDGFVAFGFGSNITCQNCFSTRNKIGYWSESSFISLSSCYGMGNSVAGLLAQNNATIQIGGSGQSLFCQNTIGAQAQYVSSIIFAASVTSGVTANPTDISLQVLSVIARESGPSLSWATKSSNITAVNTLTADGCYFQP